MVVKRSRVRGGSGFHHSATTGFQIGRQSMPSVGSDDRAVPIFAPTVKYRSCRPRSSSIEGASIAHSCENPGSWSTRTLGRTEAHHGSGSAENAQPSEIIPAAWGAKVAPSATDGPKTD